MQSIRHATQVDHQLAYLHLELWPQESPPGMSAGSLSMRDMALQTSRYYTTVDGAAALSATKELGLLYYQSETAARKLSIRYPQPIRRRSAQSNCTGISGTQALPSAQFRGVGCVRSGENGVHCPRQETRPTTECFCRITVIASSAPD